MRNERLIAAREDRGWSQQVAAEKIGVSRVAYARWEEDGIIPRLWAINRAREEFNMSAEQLGFRRYPSGTPMNRSLAQTSSAYVSGANDAGTRSAIFKVGVSALALEQQIQGYTVDELLLCAELELRRLDMMIEKQPGKNRTRREALEFLIDLPLALMGLSILGEGEKKASLLIEEVLPSYVTAVPACWRLYFEGGMAEVERVLPNYLLQLSTLAQQPSRYQKLAASAASQAYQLSWLLALQHQDFGAALIAIKQAFSYGDIADDNHLRLASLVRQAHVFFHLKQPIQQLRFHQKAMRYSSDVSPLLQGWFYVVLAESQANPLVSQQEEAKQSLSMAHDRFPEHPEDDPHFSYIPVDRFFFANHEVLTLLHLNQPKQALERLSQVDKDIPTTVVPRRVELQCRQASASLKLGDLEQTRKYVELAGISALHLGSDLRYSEACETYQQMHMKWPHERSVKALAELFQEG
jgi:transcriptional regulator with XRE-family HTH domain